MIVDFHKNFDKRYQKLNLKIQQRVDKALAVFMNNPFEPSLKNHALTGKLKGKRAFSVTADVRVIFEESDHYYLVLILDVGTHNQVY